MTVARKLTPDKVREIREAVARRKVLREELDQLTNLALAERFDVGTKAIEDIIAGRTWRDA